MPLFKSSLPVSALLAAAANHITGAAYSCSYLTPLTGLVTAAVAPLAPG